MITSDQYLNLITSEHRQKDKFVRTVSIGADFAAQMQNLLNSMIDKFDLDLATGDQLDKIGEWVGTSRNIAIPISGVYFTWDGPANIGWDYGSWQNPNQPTSITSLPNDAYRTLLRAKVAANKWDGTTTGAYEIWSTIFPALKILIQDNRDMTYGLAVMGEIIDSLTLALLTGGYLPLRPQGVKITNYYVSVGTQKVFAWDAQSDTLGGWDQAAWVKQVAAS